MDIKSVEFGRRLGSGGGGDSQSFSFTNAGLFQYPAEVKVPANVTIIPNSIGAFFGHNEVESISFESGSALTAINASAFYNNTGLKSISLPASLTNIGSSAFYGCTSLKSLTWPRGSSRVTIGEEAFGSSGVTDDMVKTILNRNLTIYAKLFKGCMSLNNIDVPFVWSSMFDNCTNLKTAIVGYDSTGMGDYVFYNCTKLTDVTIKKRNNGMTMGSGVFYKCSSLKNIKFLGLITSNAFTYVDASNPFYLCTSLENLEIPQGWTENLILSNGSQNFTNILTHDSLVAMINNLYDYSSGTAHTLTIGATNKARLSADEIAVATAKNWTIS